MGEERIGALNLPRGDGVKKAHIRSAGEADTPIWNRMSTTTKEAPAALEREWNTSQLGLRVGADALSAGAAGILIAPIITMIDKGIMENASGRNTLGVSLKNSALELLSRPHRFIASKPFVLIFSLYFGTYLTANTIDTASSTLSHTPLTSTTSGTPKFLATSTANLALCLYKDNQFTKLFSAATSTPRPVPLPTFALFTVRDCLTIFASFNLPPLLAPKFEAAMTQQLKTYVAAASVAQFVTPAAVQLFSTPLHLLGLDLYNRPEAGLRGRHGRAAKVLRDWGMSAFARVCRIVPAFGVGGVVNMKVRKALMERLE
ncbi:hypothetical protein ACN47E_008991 [Coniothyrium glycines]